MPQFRCYNCADEKTGRTGIDFDAPKGICPTCKADIETTPGSHVIAKIETVHFDPPSHIRGRGKNYIACNPKKFSTSGVYSTADHGSVTCKKCKESEEYQKSLPEEEPRLTRDMVLKVDPKTGVISSEDVIGDEFQEAGCCG